VSDNSFGKAPILVFYANARQNWFVAEPWKIRWPQNPTSNFAFVKPIVLVQV
jgi:hypothetical protein